MSQLVRIEDQTHESMGTLLSKALELYKEHIFWRSVQEGFAAQRADPQAWAEELAERKVWKYTLMDDLKEEEP